MNRIRTLVGKYEVRHERRDLTVSVCVNVCDVMQNTAHNCDPRIKKFKEEEKARKESEKKAKVEAKKREQEEKERVSAVSNYTCTTLVQCLI